MKTRLLFLAAIFGLAATTLAQNGVTRTTSAAAQTTSNIYYGGGPVMSGSTNVYVIYYGTWSTTSKNIINTWLQHIGGTNLYNINTTFHDSTAAAVKDIVNYNPTTNSYADNYSLGKTLTDASIQTIVSTAIRGGHLPNDATNGVYFVLTAADVAQSASFGTLCGNYCGYHSPSTSIMTGETIKYSIVGNFAACPSACDGSIAFGDTTTPNGDVGGDGAVNVMFHELSETVSDPNVTFVNGAWGAAVSAESGDFCNFNFGVFSTLPKASNGAHYDVTIAGVNYLIQQMFEVSVAQPVGGTYYPGSCAISLPVPATVILSPATLNMGTAFQNGPPITKAATLTNSGTTAITITSIGANIGDPFSVSATTCGSTLAAGASCSITVRFSGVNALIGLNTTTLSVVDTAPNSPQSITVKATMECPASGCRGK